MMKTYCGCDHVVEVVHHGYAHVVVLVGHDLMDKKKNNGKMKGDNKTSSKRTQI